MCLWGWGDEKRQKDTCTASSLKSITWCARAGPGLLVQWAPHLTSGLTFPSIFHLSWIYWVFGGQLVISLRITSANKTQGTQLSNGSMLGEGALEPYSWEAFCRAKQHQQRLPKGTWRVIWESCCVSRLSDRESLLSLHVNQFIIKA